MTMPESEARWVIKRNCSASPRQLALVFASIVAVSTAFGVAFAMHGAWLILPFVAIELAAVSAAFICYGRHAADTEQIEVAAGQIRVERHDGGRVQCVQIAAPWARIEVAETGRGWMQRVRLFIVAHGKRIEVGRLLPDQRRRGLARELRLALRQAAPVEG
jgi:uncharacterized membrane protein